MALIFFKLFFQIHTAYVRQIIVRNVTYTVNRTAFMNSHKNIYDYKNIVDLHMHEDKSASLGHLFFFFFLDWILFEHLEQNGNKKASLLTCPLYSNRQSCGSTKLFGSTSSTTDLRLFPYGRTAKKRLAVRASCFTLWPYRKLLQGMCAIHLHSPDLCPPHALPQGAAIWLPA